jgi:hypothetical protein
VIFEKKNHSQKLGKRNLGPITIINSQDCARPAILIHFFQK